MNIQPTPIKDLIIIKPDIYEDERGYFFESYNLNDFSSNHLTIQFVQDNESLSQKGVLRGLHFQNPPYAQDKLVRAINGSILDIAVDLRKSSESYGQSFSINLSAKNKLMLFIPVGFAHGFVTLEDQTLFSYKCSNFYKQEAENTIIWNDPDLNIDWQIEQPILSEKDKRGIPFKTYTSPF